MNNIKVGTLIDFNPLKRPVKGEVFTFAQIVEDRYDIYYIYDFRMKDTYKIFKSSMIGWYNEGMIKIYA